jgi:hypothetical protein
MSETRKPFRVKIFAFVDRIPQTKELSMVGLEFGLQVSPLTTCNCPMLQVCFFSHRFVEYSSIANPDLDPALSLKDLIRMLETQNVIFLQKILRNIP